MKKIFLIVYFINNIIAIAQVDTTFYGLRGYEDLEGNTQLFFRMLSHYQVKATEDNYKGITRRDIFHRDVKNKIDSLFILDYFDFHQPLPAIGHYVSDFEFVDSTLTNFYQCGDALKSFEPVPIVIYNREYDHPFDVESFHGTTYNLEIAKSDTNFNVYVYADNTPKGIFKKSEYDIFKFIESTENFKLVSINNTSPNMWFVEDNQGYLYRSVDTGKTFNIVDSSIVDINSNYFYFTIDNINRYFYYDPDSVHIYRVIKDENKYQLSVSNNKGELNSWQRRFESTQELFISVDHSLFGNIYLAADKQIFKSDDYGETFSLYTELENKIVGIYKKPNSDLLYATTSHKLLEINSDSVRILKELIDYETLSYYPLSIGNKWIYKRTYDWMNAVDTIYVKKEIIGKELLNNENEYYKISEIKSNNPNKYSYHERIDTASGFVYRLTDYGETILFNLKINKGDTLNIGDRRKQNFYSTEQKFYFGEYCNLKNHKIYDIYGLDNEGFTAADRFGIINKYRSIVDAPLVLDTLIGCVINGIIYGDTTLTAVNDNIDTIQIEYSLSQNYPNPFNPSTKIEYQISSNVKGEKANVSLIVYDILGREVATLVNKQQKPGHYEAQFDASDLTSGIYFYKLQSGKFVESKKMILLR